MKNSVLRLFDTKISFIISSACNTFRCNDLRYIYVYTYIYGNGNKTVKYRSIHLLYINFHYAIYS